jgi:hypothetical protein
MAKIDLIRERFKGKVEPIDFIDIANKIDDTKTKKYIEHLVRFTRNLSKDFESSIYSEMNYIMDNLKKFDELATNGMIETPDLNKYKKLSEVVRSIKEATLTKSIGKAKKEIKILYEDDNYMLFLPLSYDAASVYGRGTKWCVTQNEYFYRYSDRGVLAYFIEKNINRKIGLYYDMDFSYYHSNNKTNDEVKKGYLDERDEEDLRNDSEMIEMYDFSRKFSCWTNWDVKMEMMFVPIPLHIKELYINYCKENNVQNASLFDEVENGNFIKYHEEYNRISQEEPMAEAPMMGEAIPEYYTEPAMDETAVEYPTINETFEA